MAEALRVADLRAGYGSAAVLHGVSLDVAEGEIAVLLGANGVGKTTTLRAVAGLVRPWSGTVTLAGRAIDRLAPERVVRLGVGMVPGPPGIFRDLSVIDNLRVGGIAVPRARAEDRIGDVLASFPVLDERRTQRAGSLSGGEQRMLAIARALMGEPRLLLVDEPSMGLSPAMTSNMLRLLERIRGDGVTILMAEQNVAALDVADRAFVLSKGVVTSEARGEEVRGMHDAVARAYLGARAPVEAGTR